MVLGRRRSNQVTIISRVTKIAVKTEVMMPRPRVTAKPRTGPEPIANRIAAAMKVVTFASTMALRAFS